MLALKLQGLKKAGEKEVIKEVQAFNSANGGCDAKELISLRRGKSKWLGRCEQRVVQCELERMVLTTGQ